MLAVESKRRTINRDVYDGFLAFTIEGHQSSHSLAYFQAGVSQFKFAGMVFLLATVEDNTRAINMGEWGKARPKHDPLGRLIKLQHLVILVVRS